MEQHRADLHVAIRGQVEVVAAGSARDRDVAKEHRRTDLAPTITQTFVRTGVSVMPPFRKTEIGDADLAALAAYLAPRAH